jgi:hypothetical protein
LRCVPLRHPCLGRKKKLFNIAPAPTVSYDTNHPPRQPTHPRVTDICRLLILTLLLVEDDIQTLSHTPSEIFAELIWTQIRVFGRLLVSRTFLPVLSRSDAVRGSRELRNILSL